LFDIQAVAGVHGRKLPNLPRPAKAAHPAHGRFGSFVSTELESLW
jgi:hypothetical protein